MEKITFALPKRLLTDCEAAAEATGGRPTREWMRAALAEAVRQVLGVPEGTPRDPHGSPAEQDAAQAGGTPSDPPRNPIGPPREPRGGDYRGGGVEVGVSSEEEQPPEQNTPPPPSPRRKAKASVPAHLEDATADNPPLPDRLAPFADAWKVFLEYRQHRKKPPVTVYGARSLLKQFEKYPPEAFRVAIEAAMANSWQGLIFDDGPAGWSGAASRSRPVTPGSDESRQRRSAEIDERLSRGEAW